MLKWGPGKERAQKKTKLPFPFLTVLTAIIILLSDCEEGYGRLCAKHGTKADRTLPSNMFAIHIFFLFKQKS